MADTRYFKILIQYGGSELGLNFDRTWPTSVRFKFTQQYGRQALNINLLQ